ncbi:MAG TPA: glycosyltransferase, partial [Pseudomonadales bacterium]|nr:glycosyltransferase [Pseudomonadales bacterium]
MRELDGTFPRPSASALQQAARAFATTPTGTVTLVDGLVLGAIPEIVITESSRLPIVAFVHLPLGADPGLDVETAARLEGAERRALGAAARVIVTGRATLPLLEGYGLPPSRVVIIEPGTDRARLSSGSDGSPLRLLCVATLNPGKGHEALLAALASAPTRDWHLTCAGSLTRHPATVDRVQAAMRRLRLDDRVALAGELDAAALEECYHHSDVFVL